MNEKFDLSDASIYQAIYKDGKLLKKGWRNNKRNHYISWERLKGRTVLDLACNNGMMSIQAKLSGASRVVGVDFGDMIPFAKRLAKQFNVEIEYWHLDLRSLEFINHCPRFDFVFCFSILHYIQKKSRFLTFLDRCTHDTLWVETNHKILAQLVYENLKKYTSFDGIRILGQSEDDPEKGGHWMIRCRRNQQWVNAPVTFIPLDQIVVTHGLEGYKDTNRYPQDAYKRKSKEIGALMNDIGKFGQRAPLWVRKFEKGKHKGKFRVIEGHARQISRMELAKNQTKVYDIPCRILPQKPSDWLRKHGFDLKDLEE